MEYWALRFTTSKKCELGKNTVEQLAAFIQQKEPSIRGFTVSNIWCMKQFFEIYQDNEKLASLGRELSWTQNRRIMTLKTPEERVKIGLLKSVFIF